MKNPRLNPIYGILILLVFGVGGILGVYYTSTQEITTYQAVVNWVEPASAAGVLTYTANNDLFTVTERSVSMREIFNAEILAKQSQDCDTKHDAEYYNNLLSKFGSNARLSQYVFRYGGTSQNPVRWLVTILPNKTQYQDLVAFEADFKNCAAGGDYNPYQVTSDNLLFVSSCGTGVDDGSGRPFGCKEISDAVMPTMRVN